jgi:death on curing protein
MVFLLWLGRIFFVSNHPFVDGNKRAGVLSALVFLDLNGVTIALESQDLYWLTMGVAEGKIEKSSVGVELKQISEMG